MTERLFAKDSYLTENDAMVLTSEPAKGGYLVTLDRSVLFPEAGGQPADHGTIGDARVLDAHERGGEIYYLTDRAVPAGGRVRVTLDFARRFDFMQQHTGEHLLSFVAFQKFGAVNVGFHLAETYTTIDLDKPLTADEVSALAAETNALLSRDLPVTAAVYDSEEALSGLKLRKHAEGLHAPIRIVSIEGADVCTCCAPHCRRTGEAGSLIITDAAAYKGGTRLTFLFGKRASDYAARQHAALDRIARRFSTARDGAEAAVEKLIADCAEARRQVRELGAQLSDYQAAELLSGAAEGKRAKLIAALLPGMDAARLKQLGTLLSERGAAAVLLTEKDGQLLYVVTVPEGFSPDAGALAQAVNAATGGRGGGRGTLAQGMAKSAAGAAETAAQLRDYLIRSLGKDNPHA